jgi:Holliday junction resolvase RusA-like endonuclease
VIVDDNKDALKAWRAQVSTAAAVLHHDDVDEASAFAVVLEFGMPRPKTVKRELPTVKPDLDKLTRALLDALTGRVWKDDAQVVRLVVDKAYSERPGVEIRVGRITPTRESR